MQYLDPIYVIPHLIGHKIQIQLKDFLFCKISLQIIYFQNRNAHTFSLFIESNILKLSDKTALENCRFINEYFSKYLLPSDFQIYNTCWSKLDCLAVPPNKTKLYGRNSVNVSVFYTWNYLQKLNDNNLFY